MRIDLTRHEFFICEYIGSIRRKNAMTHNTDRQISNQDPFQQDIDGFVGEYIVAKYFNLMPDFSVNPKKNPIDLISRTGKSLDVKTTRNKDGKVYVTDYHKNNPCDFYILVVIDDKGGDIAGWIDQETLFSIAKTITKKDKSGKDHTSYVIEQEQLSKIKDY